MQQMPGQSPIVIFGGFLSNAYLYRDLQRSVAQLTGATVSVVPACSADWLAAVSLLGVTSLLVKLDRSVRAALRLSPTGKVTIIGHSAGGVFARLYLGIGSSFTPRNRRLEPASLPSAVDHLVTLGSPHTNRARLMHGARIARFIEKRYPGACFAPSVRYTSVAGRWLRGSAGGSPAERRAYSLYRSMCGDGAAWGDGVVPLESALLSGSRQIVIEGARHYSIMGQDWFGSPAIIRRWLLVSP